MRDRIKFLYEFIPCKTASRAIENIKVTFGLPTRIDHFNGYRWLVTIKWYSQ